MDFPALDNRYLELTDLIVFRQIRIEIVFACENRMRCDMRIDRQAKLNGSFNGSSVQNRQTTRQRHVNFVGLGVGQCAIAGAAAGKDFGFGRQLGMCFKPDNDFPFHYF